MKFFLAFFAITFSASLTAKVITFQCEGPDEVAMHFVDMENKTWERSGRVFDDVSVSANAITSSGSYEESFFKGQSPGLLVKDVFSISRVDLTYSRQVTFYSLEDFNFNEELSSHPYSGQCKIVEDQKIERAF